MQETTFQATIHLITNWNECSHNIVGEDGECFCAVRKHRGLNADIFFQEIHTSKLISVYTVNLLNKCLFHCDCGRL